MKIVWLVSARRDAGVDSRLFRAKPGLMSPIASCARSSTRPNCLMSRPIAGARRNQADGIHELVVPSLPYILPYRVKDGRIEILRIFHTSQEPLESGDLVLESEIRPPPRAA